VGRHTSPIRLRQISAETSNLSPARCLRLSERRPLISDLTEVPKEPMRVVILGLCTLVAGGVFTAILLSVWCSRGSAGRAADLRQGMVAELVWAAIPCLIVIAASIPAAIAIAAALN
jgi:hypothetical protein